MNQYKVVFLGDCAVGKSSIIYRFISNCFNENSESTVGSSFFQYNSIENNIRLNIWDTAGQERYKALVPFYYKKSQFAVIVFDVENRESYESAKNWTFRVMNDVPECIIHFVGNKCDRNSLVSEQEQLEFCIKNNLKYHRTSAKTGEGIEIMFHSMIIDSIKNEKSFETIFLNNTEQTSEQSSWCCY